ncbi:MAG: response regulator receiver protein [Alphaproteobacteria bacterium]|jgi:DNA-binding response OmpR family regulator|nr:response regulator receiver protein [Alphaproteobacteria bacterium]
MEDKLRIMVVDDEEQVRGVVCENLSACGFDVVYARDGQEALNMIDEGTHQPQIVITDIIMPRKEGLEVIMELRRRHPDIRLIAISGGGRTKSADFLHLAKKLGADAILPKPLDIDMLEKTVRELVA